MRSMRGTLHDSNVPSGGLRVRRKPSMDSQQVGSLHKFNHAYHFVSIQGDWAKLAPSEYGNLESSVNFKPHDAGTEGWCLLRLSHEPLLIFESASNQVLLRCC